MEVTRVISDKTKRDYDLIQRALSGEQTAYSQLMGHYRDSVYHTIIKMVKSTEDAEDLTIEAFGKAFNRLDQYSHDFAFSTWLFKIATNNCIDFIRKKRIKVTSMDTGFTTDDGEIIYVEAQASNLTPEEEIIHNQKVKLMRHLVTKLKPHYRELVELRYFEELSYEEIAETLNLPLGTVKAQLFRARDFMATLIQKTKDTI
jgi:RNA polymerase sigma-70 factor (ECF subfamily)